MRAAVTVPRARSPQRSPRDDHEPPFLPRPARSCVGRATHGARRAEKHAGQRVRSPGMPARVSGHCAR